MRGKRLLSAAGPDGFPRNLQVLSVTQTSGFCLHSGGRRGLELGSPKQPQPCNSYTYPLCREDSRNAPLPAHAHLQAPTQGAEFNDSCYSENTFYVSGDMQSALILPNTPLKKISLNLFSRAEN